MSWRGTMREVSASIKRAERDRERNRRQEERAAKLSAKLADHERARLEVEEYEERISALISAHRECGESVSWEQIISTPIPREPERQTIEEGKARCKLTQYTPSFFDFIFQRAEGQKQELQREVEVGRYRDEQDFAARMKSYLVSLEEWEHSQQLAEAVLQGDVQAFRQAMEVFSPFSEMAEIGCRVNFEVHSPSVVEAAFTVDGDHVVPREIKSIGASGKLLSKRMPRGQFFELYQDYVCGCALRIGREFVALLPVKIIFVNGYSEMLNRETGHVEVTPVVGIAMPRSTIEKLRFEAVDPSESLKNFIHRMGFKRSAGFNRIEPMTVADLPREYMPTG